MVVQVQIISYILQNADDSILEDNQLTADYFVGYDDEYKFIREHKEKYGNVPDKETFLLH